MRNSAADTLVDQLASALEWNDGVMPKPRRKVGEDSYTFTWTKDDRNVEVIVSRKPAPVRVRVFDRNVIRELASDRKSGWIGNFRMAMNWALRGGRLPT